MIGRIALISLVQWLCASALDVLRGQSVQVTQSHAGVNCLPERGKNLRHEPPSLAHRSDFSGALQLDFHLDSTSSVTTSPILSPFPDLSM